MTDSMVDSEGETWGEIPTTVCVGLKAESFRNPQKGRKNPLEKAVLRQVVFLGLETHLDPCDLQEENWEIKHHTTTEFTDLIHSPCSLLLPGLSIG